MALAILHHTSHLPPPACDFLLRPVTYSPPGPQYTTQSTSHTLCIQRLVLPKHQSPHLLVHLPRSAHSSSRQSRTPAPQTLWASNTPIRTRQVNPTSQSPPSQNTSPNLFTPCTRASYSLTTLPSTHACTKTCPLPQWPLHLHAPHCNFLPTATALQRPTPSSTWSSTIRSSTTRH